MLSCFEAFFLCKGFAYGVERSELCINQRLSCLEGRTFNSASYREMQPSEYGKVNIGAVELVEN